MSHTTMYNAKAWGHASVLSFFKDQRKTKSHVYPSEWFFLEKKLQENLSILDIGCAQGGFSNIVSEQIHSYSYVGIDINEDMIFEAKARYPQHRFHHIAEAQNYDVLQGEKYDLVLCLGILHLHETWRDTIQQAWAHTRGSLILDLRETHECSIEDKKCSYFKMDFEKNEPVSQIATIPYNIINAGEAQKTILELCENAIGIKHYGYIHPISDLAVSPIRKVMTNVYCIERACIQS